MTISPARAGSRRAGRILVRDAAEKALANRSVTEIFVHRDVSAVKRYFGSVMLPALIVRRSRRSELCITCSSMEAIRYSLTSPRFPVGISQFAL